MSKAASSLVSTIIMKDKVSVRNVDTAGSGNCASDNSDAKKVKEGHKDSKYWIDQLSLQPHPFMEEVYFRETFIDTQMVQIKKDSSEETKPSVENGFSR